MRILYLVPGSGGSFYCQNCLRDYAIVRALRKQGHDVIIVPLYLPMFDQQMAAESDAPIFFGGINAYLRERIPLFRKAPRWIERLLDARWILRRAASREGTTKAADLGAMTLSMLNGREGNQKKEYERFMEWIGAQEKPDVIHVSNALLLGFAPLIRDTLGVPLVCGLQDEEPWVDAMREPHSRLCWDALADRGQHVAAFVSTSRWYADRMIDRMGIPPGRMRVVHPGIDAAQIRPVDLSFDPPAIGYLARINEAQGFDAVFDAFLQLRAESAFSELKLRATGGATPADRVFLQSVQARLREAGATDSVHIDREFQTLPHPDFFDGLSVMSTPVRGGEAFGMPLIEAMARGIPVVQPNVGSYPEILAEGGGVLYDPAEDGGLADALRSVLSNPEYARDLGCQGREVVLRRFTVDRAAREMINIYESVAGRLLP
ncbi:MAG TPA: glycosyltransferase family 4 protein [Candidatus Hydrogenedentes bacterium]|nr:glycosyltransferase family 4 protein [Candidatus Hydrogenedentota bacterium]HPC15491.1 glycosyltransferase family 4 protein [Candidatus Hydrogenedentota bacterium]HRT20232.1 glycosyltransferase family 4 protein [Candidatus Hydrogenedentota bacterium]HRT64294.1 glycosyltransferase family 4 protein [Candidatus Hydrogenedentota bacterium]